MQQGQDQEDEETPTTGMDYGFLKSEEVESEAQKGPMLVMKGIKHGMLRSMVVPAKGAATEWVVKSCVRWTDELGYGKLILKPDQEASISALLGEIKRVRHAA